MAQQSTQCGASSVTQGVSPLCSDVFLYSGERKALLPATEWEFYITQEDLASDRPFLFKLTVSHTEELWQFVFATGVPNFLGIVLWD